MIKPTCHAMAMKSVKKLSFHPFVANVVRNKWITQKLNVKPAFFWRLIVDIKLFLTVQLTDCHLL